MHSFVPTKRKETSFCNKMKKQKLPYVRDYTHSTSAVCFPALRNGHTLACTWRSALRVLGANSWQQRHVFPTPDNGRIKVSPWGSVSYSTFSALCTRDPFSRARQRLFSDQLIAHFPLSQGVSHVSRHFLARKGCVLRILIGHYPECIKKVLSLYDNKPWQPSHP